MPQYETAASKDNFTYRFNYSEGNGGWVVDNMEVLKDGQQVYRKDDLQRVFPLEAVAIAQCITWCETIIDHLSNDQAHSPALQ